MMRGTLCIGRPSTQTTNREMRERLVLLEWLISTLLLPPGTAAARVTVTRVTLTRQTCVGLLYLLIMRGIIVVGIKNMWLFAHLKKKVKTIYKKHFPLDIKTRSSHTIYSRP